MNKRIKFRLNRVITILIVWLIIAVVIAVYETLFLQNFEGIFENSYLAHYSFQKTLVAGLSTTFVGVLSIGLLEELYFE